MGQINNIDLCQRHAPPLKIKHAYHLLETAVAPNHTRQKGSHFSTTI